MPRHARIQSQSNMYHVMLRGINKQQIFYDEDDYLQFLSVLKKYKIECGFSLHAYCLMSNHIHLLIQTGEATDLGNVFKHIGTSFVYRYNIKYDRTGHLFQDRFRSEPVDSDVYFMTVLRYILQNPVAAGICKYPSEYRYSSASEYLEDAKGITDTDFACSLLGKDLKEYLNRICNGKCLDIEQNAFTRCSDQQAINLIKEKFGTLTPEVGKSKEREIFAKEMKKLISQGISIRQMSRLSGISKNIIERMLKEK